MKDHKKPKLKLVKGQAKTRTRLTAKQSKFIDGILGIGVDQPLTLTDSYKASYDCKNFSDANVSESFRASGQAQGRTAFQYCYFS